MKTGLSIPTRTNRGRSVTESGDRENAKIIVLAMGEGGSANPFNGDVGVESPVFELQGSAASSVMEHRIKTHMARLERDHRVKLQDLEFREVGSEMGVTVNYVDLETDEALAVSRKVTRSGS